MRLRLVEAQIPTDQYDATLEALPAKPLFATRIGSSDDGTCILRMMHWTENAEDVVRFLEQSFEQRDDFWIILLSVEGMVPRPEEPESDEDEEEQAPAAPDEQESDRKSSPVNIEEIYEDLLPALEVSPRYAVWIVLSVLVAAVGLRIDSLAVVIGAMIIAPLLVPAVALSLATTLGDLKLASLALKVTGFALAVGLVTSVALGFAMPLTLDAQLVRGRTQLRLLDLVIGAAAGAIGVLSYTTGIQAAQVGVMVAVALLPPLVVAGMLAGMGEWMDALRATLVLLTTLVGLNAAGVVTFLAQRVRPRKPREEERARRSVRGALMLWSIMIVLLGGLILLLREPLGA